MKKETTTHQGIDLERHKEIGETLRAMIETLVPIANELTKKCGIMSDQAVCGRKIVLDMDSLRRKMEIELWTNPESHTFDKLGIYCPTPVTHRKKVVWHE